MWVAGGVDLPLPVEDVSALASLSVPMHTSAATGRAGPPSPVERPESWRSRLRCARAGAHSATCRARSGPGRTGLREVARCARRAGVRALARRLRRWRRPRSSSGVSNTSNASALPCSGVVTSASIEVVAARLPRTRHKVDRHCFYARRTVMSMSTDIEIFDPARYSPVGGKAWETTVGITKQKAAENREAIVTAADGLFRERGVDAVGLNELMGAAGPTRGGFHNHLPSKS